MGIGLRGGGSGPGGPGFPGGGGSGSPGGGGRGSRRGGPRRGRLPGRRPGVPAACVAHARRRHGRVPRRRAGQPGFGRRASSAAGRHLRRVRIGRPELTVEYIEGADDEDIEKKLNGRGWPSPSTRRRWSSSRPRSRTGPSWRSSARPCGTRRSRSCTPSPDDMPVFNGVDLQRRTFNARGEEIEGWQSIDLATNSQELRAVKLYYNEDPADLKRVELHEDHMLVMPLPHEIAGKYPEMKLKTHQGQHRQGQEAGPQADASRRRPSPSSPARATRSSGTTPQLRPVQPGRRGGRVVPPPAGHQEGEAGRQRDRGDRRGAVRAAGLRVRPGVRHRHPGRPDVRVPACG